MRKLLLGSLALAIALAQSIGCAVAGPVGKYDAKAASDLWMQARDLEKKGELDLAVDKFIKVGELAKSGGDNPIAKFMLESVLTKLSTIQATQFAQHNLPRVEKITRARMALIPPGDKAYEEEQKYLSNIQIMQGRGAEPK